MRVIAGLNKGRKLIAPKGLAIRPTPDRVREALFSILGEKVVGAAALDLFAGTGALGIEALSRGAAAATFVDYHPQALRTIKINLNNCGFPSLKDRQEPQGVKGQGSGKYAPQVDLVRGEVLKVLPQLAASGRSYQLVLADPPYQTRLGRDILEILVNSQLCCLEGGLIVIEHTDNQSLPEGVQGWSRERLTKYGKTCLSFYSHPPNPGLAKLTP